MDLALKTYKGWNSIEKKNPKKPNPLLPPPPPPPPPPSSLYCCCHSSCCCALYLLSLLLWFLLFFWRLLLFYLLLLFLMLFFIFFTLSSRFFVLVYLLPVSLSLSIYFCQSIYLSLSISLIFRLINFVYSIDVILATASKFDEKETQI